MLARGETETSPLSLLTARQREILQLIAEGQSTKEIGYRLALSTKTVETHRRLLMERLGIHDVAGLARFAVRAGLVSADLCGDFRDEVVTTAMSFLQAECGWCRA